jgi:hypothetical protein
MKKELFRDHFKDYVSRMLKCQFDSLDYKRRSVWMARFYADRVLRQVYPSLIPEAEEDLNECAIDGSDDCGVDFLTKQGSTVLILQSKYSSAKKRGKKLTEEPETFAYFSNVLQRLYAGPQSLKMNRKLKEAIADIDWERDAFHLHYITLYKPAENDWTIATKGIAALPNVPDLPERTTLELLDEEKLNIALREALQQEHCQLPPIRIAFSRNAEPQPAWLCFEDPTDQRHTYVGRINGAQVATLFKAHKSRLFTLNIRNYIGDTTTNREIRATAEQTPGQFFYRNNGICAVAARISPDDCDNNVLNCENLSIINGAQTVRSLAKAHTDDSKAVHQVEVLLRIVEYRPKITEAEQTFLDNVIKYNNTQNAIKLSDFRSNDRVQYSLRKQFSELPSRAGRKFLYKNKRSGERDANYIGIGMEEFIKTVYAFQFGPDDVFGGTQNLFDTGDGGGYRKLFGDGSGDVISDRFKELAGIWFLCEYVNHLWKECRSTDPAEALERRWMVYFTVGESIRMVYKHQGRDTIADLMHLADPRWKDGSDAKCEHQRAVTKAHTDAAFKAMKKAYENARKLENFAHRNWFRDDSTLDEIRSELDSFVGFMAQMPEKYMYKTE